MIKNLWKKMTVGFCVLVIAFAIFGAFKDKLHWAGEISADGLATLAGGTLAFLAVMWQIDADKQARMDEAERQKRAMATALFYEIWDFNRHHIQAMLQKSENADEVKFLHRSFDAWQGVACRIGELDQAVVEAVVRFYDVANEYLGALDRYVQLSDQGREEKFYEKLEQKLQPLATLAETACRQLAALAGIKF